MQEKFFLYKYDGARVVTVKDLVLLIDPMGA